MDGASDKTAETQQSERLGRVGPQRFAPPAVPYPTLPNTLRAKTHHLGTGTPTTPSVLRRPREPYMGMQVSITNGQRRTEEASLS